MLTGMATRNSVRSGWKRISPSASVQASGFSLDSLGGVWGRVRQKTDRIRPSSALNVKANRLPES